MGTTGSPAGAAVRPLPSAGSGAVPVRGLRRPAYDRASSTGMPGRLATKLRTPYTTATVRPVSAPSPAAPKAQAVTPSRGPQPPTFSGSP
ncbi:hypothetical protein, partial [Streptomyces sp. NPDC003554]